MQREDTSFSSSLRVDGDDKVNRVPILVMGHSHTEAIRSALTNGQTALIQVINFGLVYEKNVGKLSTLPSEMLEEYAPKHVFCSFGGSEHSVFGLVEAPTRFDFFSPHVPGVEEGRQIVPYGMVRQTLQAAMRRKLNLLQSASRSFGVPTTHICSPAPFRKSVGNVRLPRVFDSTLHHGIVPDSIRKKLHCMHSDIVRAHCVEHGIGFLDTPVSSLDAEGFLLPTMFREDPTHGNRAYGELVIQQILEAIHV